MADFPETDLFNRAKALNLPADSFIVVGSGAIEAIVGPEVRRAQDIDLVVTEEAFDYLRNRPGMVEQRFSNGYHNLVGDGFDISTSWRSKDVEKLQAGGYVAKEGVYVAGFPEVYAYKQERGTPKDLTDLVIMQNRLYSKELLPPEVIAGERRFVESCMPEHLHGRPELDVAANGLYIVRTVFGDREEIGGQTYSGEVEPGAVAIQHCWVHSAFGLRAGQRNIDKINAQREQEGREPLFSNDDRSIAAAAYGNHDAKVGHGRFATNPLRHDERQSADHVVAQLEEVGVTDEESLAKAHASVMATTYNEGTKSQDVDPSRGHLHMQELSAGEDFAIFRSPFSVSDSYNLAAENLTRVGGGYDQPLNRLVEELNAQRPEGTPAILIRNPEEALELIHQYPDYPATRLLGDKPVQITIVEAFTEQLDGSAGFYEKYTPPGEWLDGDAKYLAENADRIRKGAAAIREGKLTPLQSYEAQMEFEAALHHPSAVGGLPGMRPDRSVTSNAMSQMQSEAGDAAKSATDSSKSTSTADHRTEEGTSLLAEMRATLEDVDTLLSTGSLHDALSLLEESAMMFTKATTGATHKEVRDGIAAFEAAKSAIQEAEKITDAAKKAVRRYRERFLEGA